MDVICDKCNKTFSRKQYLYHHLRNVHKLEVKTTKKPWKVVCSFCNLACSSHADLREHLVSVHEVEIFKEIVNFKKKEDFISWKSEKEKSMKCLYVQSTGAKKVGSVKKTYYNCHRSLNSNHSNKEDERIGQRKLKSQGYSKLNFSCPSTLELVEEDGMLGATLYFPHIGHDCSLVHINLTTEEKTLIAGLRSVWEDMKSTGKEPEKIAIGLSFDHILNEIRNSCSSPESLQRIHLIDRQDLRNIKRQYGIEDQVEVEEEETLPVGLKPRRRGSTEDDGTETVTLNSDRVKLKLDELIGIITNNSFSDDIHNEGERDVDNLLALYSSDKYNDSKEPAKYEVEVRLATHPKRKKITVEQCSSKTLYSEEKSTR